MMNPVPVLYIANKFGATTETRGAVDNMTGEFFRAIRLNMGDGQIKQPYKEHVWTYSCISAKATAIKNVPFLIVKDAKDNQGRARAQMREIRAIPAKYRYQITAEELTKRGFDIIETGPAFDLFSNPNPIMTRAQLWESWIVLMDLFGAAFWILEGGNGAVSENQFPVEIWPCKPEEFEPKFDDAGNLIKWRRVPFGRRQEKIFDLWQVIWFHRYNPYEELTGLAPYEAVKKAASQDYKAQVFNEAFFDNSADPGGILKVKDFLDPEQSKSMLREWNDKHKGASKGEKTALLQGGAEYDRNPRTHVDMQFLDGRKWNRDETFAAFGTPKMMASIYEDLQLATAQVAEKNFWTNTIVPDLQYIEDLLNGRAMFGNSKIKDIRGAYCLFDLSNVQALRDDLGKKLASAQIACQIGATFNDVNEVLELGFPEYDWGDKWYRPFSLVSDDNASASPPQVGAGSPPAAPAAAPAEPPPEEMPMKSAAAIIVAKADDAQQWDQWIARVFGQEKRFQAKIKLYWYDLRTHQLQRLDEFTKALTRKMPIKEELDQILFNDAQWNEQLQKTAKPFIMQAAQSSLDHFAIEIGISPWQITDPRIASVLQEKVIKITGINTRFREQLRQSMIDGIDAGETVTELSQRVRNEFNFAATPSRTLTIARTETAQTASTVRNINMIGEGVKQQQWITAGDEHVRDSHVVFGGAGPQDIGFNFCSLVGEPGELLYPSDMAGPAGEVINCRCVATAVV